MPRLTIIIVNYNYQVYILDAIKSAMCQTYNNLEIIVVDHSSTDNSDYVIKNYLDQCEYKKRINYIRTQKNYGGPSHPRNLGIEKAQGEYILCLDGDDMIHPNFVEDGLNLLTTNLADFLIPSIKHFGSVNNLEKSYEYDNDLIYFENILPYCCIYKKSAWKESGKYKEDLLILEDWEFFLSATKNNLKITRINEPYFLYRKHGNSVWDQTFDDDARILQEIKVIKQYHPDFPIMIKKDILHFLGSHHYCQSAQYQKLNKLLTQKAFQRIKEKKQIGRKLLQVIDKTINKI